MRPIGTTVISLFALTLMGCAAKYHVGVTTYQSPHLAFPPPGLDHRIAVVTESRPDEPLLEEEVKAKVEGLLRRRGYAVGSLNEANYVLAASFAIDDGREHLTSNVLYSSKGVTAIPYSYTSFTRFLGLDLLGRDRWVRAGREDAPDAIVWRATAYSSGSSSDLRSVIDYLLVATFEHFGEDTGRQVRTTLRDGDKRVRELRDAVRHLPTK